MSLLTARASASHVLVLNLRQHIFGESARDRKNQLVAMAGKIPKPSEVDADNIQRPKFEQLSAEDQKALEDIRKKIRKEQE